MAHKGSYNRLVLTFYHLIYIYIFIYILYTYIKTTVISTLALFWFPTPYKNLGSEHTLLTKLGSNCRADQM